MNLLELSLFCLGTVGLLGLGASLVVRRSKAAPSVSRGSVMQVPCATEVDPEELATPLAASLLVDEVNKVAHALKDFGFEADGQSAAACPMASAKGALIRRTLRDKATGEKVVLCSTVFSQPVAVGVMFKTGWYLGTEASNARIEAQCNSGPLKSVARVGLKALQDQELLNAELFPGKPEHVAEQLIYRTTA